MRETLTEKFALKRTQFVKWLNEKWDILIAILLIPVAIFVVWILEKNEKKTGNAVSFYNDDNY